MEPFYLSLIVAGILIGVSVIVPFFFAKDKRDRVYADIVQFGIMSGLLSMIVGNAAETHYVSQHTESVRKDMKEVREDVGRLDPLSGANDEAVREFVDQLIQKYSSVKSLESTVFTRELQRLQNEFSLRLADLAAGKMRVPGGDLKMFASRVCKEAEREIWTTSLITNRWVSVWGAEYWETQLQLMQEKPSLEIRRIFIADPKCLQDSEFKRVARMNRDAGVGVYFVDRTSLPVEQAKDFIVIDDKVAAESQFSVDGGILSATVYVSDADVESFRRMYEVLKSQATELK